MVCFPAWCSEDPLYMPQIISSAIVNAPPPHPVIRMMVRTNFASEQGGSRALRCCTRPWGTWAAMGGLGSREGLSGRCRHQTTQN